MLKTRKVVRLEVDFSDLQYEINKFLRKEFGKNAHDYDIVAEEEWYNNTAYDYTVKEQNLNETNYNEYKAGDYGRGSTHYILNWMCFQGVIKPGKYLVHCRW
jgi:hypothetical protein